MATLLILSVGTLVGSSVLDAAERHRPGLRVLGTNSLADAPNNFRCDRVFLAPAAREAEAYGRCVESVLEREQPDLVLPGRDEDVPLMAGWRERHPRWARCLAVGSATPALAMVDKLVAHDWSVARGLPFAPTVLAGDADAPRRCAHWRDAHGAVVAKPRRGSGSRGVRVLPRAPEAAFAPDEILQPWLAEAQVPDVVMAAGWPLFHAPAQRQVEAQVAIGPDGALLGRVDVETILVAGRCEKARVLDDPDVRRIGDAYGQALAEAGWRGLASVQLLNHPRFGYQAIEFNAPPGGMRLRQLLGFDELDLLLSAWTGERPAPPPPAAATALRMTRDVCAPADEAHALQEAGTWPSC